MINIYESKPYKDESGNQLSCQEGVVFKNSRVCFGETGSNVEIGEGVVLTDCIIRVGRNSKCVISKNSSIKGEISIGLNSSVLIGYGLKVTKNILIRAVEGTEVVIGDDCLVASNVVIRTTDGHPIYDSSTGERINNSKSIKISDHVWLSDGVSVFKGVSIGACSVIAAGAVVTKDIAGKCIAAGVPAKVIKENIVWEHNAQIKTDKYYE